MSFRKPNLTLSGKGKYLWVILLMVALDQISKWIVAKNLALYEVRKVIPGFFRIWRIHNPGAVWGMFSDHWSGPIPKIITTLSLAAFVVVAIFFLKVSAQYRIELLSFALVISGALGNNIDRLCQGYVVDFLDFFHKSYHFPTFNVADSCISVGVALLAWGIWRGKCSPL